MAKIDNIISIIMVFVTAIGFARATGMSLVMTVVTVIMAFILYELILNVANSNPSIRTMLFVTNGFVFGLSLTVILKFDHYDLSWLSALICLLCMGYKYMVAEATAVRHSYSRNIYVIVVNAFFYSCMFTVVECMAFREMTTLFVMIYVASFAFFMCSYVSIKRSQPIKRRQPAGGSGRESLDFDGDWRHIVKRVGAYGRELKEQFDDALDKSGDTFSGLVDELRKKIVPDYSDGMNENDEIKDELDEYRQQITKIAAKEDLDDNELEILGRINKEFDEIYFDFFRSGEKPLLEYEVRISELSNDIEMLKNTINVRKAREEEERQKQSRQSKRSQAQQARRKREREERERREREEREAEEAKKKKKTGGTRDDIEEELRKEYEKAVEEERKRREEERKRQEKRRRERNKRTTRTDDNARNAGNTEGNGSNANGGTGKGSSGSSTSGTNNGGRNTGGRNSQSSKNSGQDNGSSTVAGIETKYFKGCTNVDELSLRYKKLCLIYHPDSGNGDVDTYIELKDEYELLKKRLS